jgi:hypothetical protein
MITQRNYPLTQREIDIPHSDEGRARCAPADLRRASVQRAARKHGKTITKRGPKQVRRRERLDSWPQCFVARRAPRFNRLPPVANRIERRERLLRADCLRQVSR